MNYFIPNWFFHLFVGCDPNLISRCSSSERIKFIFTGILVLVVTTLTGVSSLYIVWDIFISANFVHDYIWYLEVFLGYFLAICWTLIIFNLFRVLITTVARSDEVGFYGFGRLFSISLQICISLVLALAMGIPLLLFLLHSQLDIQNKSEVNLRPAQISMTVDYMSKHPKISTMDSYYEKLQQLKTDEFNLKIRSSLYKNNKKMFEEINFDLDLNQALQKDIYKDIYDLRTEIEKDFLLLKESELSMQLIKRAGFLWSHNIPISVFFLLFIFLLYSSFIFAKILCPLGLYDYLVKYEGRNTLLLNGIQEVHLPVSIDGRMVTSFQYHSSDLLLARNVEMLSEQLDSASQQLKSNFDLAKSSNL
jgi:hypothetical protein